MIVDALGRVAYASRAAEALLAAPSAPLARALDGTLRASAWVPDGVNTELRRLLASAPRLGGSVRLPPSAPPQSDKGAPVRACAGVLLTILPLDAGAGVGPAALVLVEGPPKQSALAEAWRVRYGLTPAEAKVGMLLAERGWGAKQIARELGVRPTTVRTHLQRLLEKTGTHGRTELALLLRGPVASGWRP